VLGLGKCALGDTPRLASLVKLATVIATAVTAQVKREVVLPGCGYQ
jgi:hypothetical protein